MDYSLKFALAVAACIIGFFAVLWGIDELGKHRMKSLEAEKAAQKSAK